MPTNKRINFSGSRAAITARINADIGDDNTLKTAVTNILGLMIDHADTQAHLDLYTIYNANGSLQHVELKIVNISVRRPASTSF